MDTVVMNRILKNMLPLFVMGLKGLKFSQEALCSKAIFSKPSR